MLLSYLHYKQIEAAITDWASGEDAHNPFRAASSMAVYQSHLMFLNKICNQMPVKYYIMMSDLFKLARSVIFRFFGTIDTNCTLSGGQLSVSVQSKADDALAHLDLDGMKEDI